MILRAAYETVNHESAGAIEHLPVYSEKVKDKSSVNLKVLSLRGTKSGRGEIPTSECGQNGGNTLRCSAQNYYLVFPFPI